MKKPLFVIACLLLALSAMASSAGTKMGDTIVIPIQHSDEELPQNRPRSSPIFTASLDTSLELLSISSLYNVGDVYAVIENLTTGEYAEYSFASSSTAFLPISGDSGYWRITLTLESGEGYYGVFVL